MLDTKNDEIVERLAGRCHFLQSAEWAEARAKTGWKYFEEKLKLENGEELPVILYRRKIPFLGTVVYAPKIGGITVGNVSEVDALAKRVMQPSDIMFKLEADVPKDENLQKAFKKKGWVINGRAIQYSATVTLRLDKSEEELMLDVKPKDRRKIRLAMKSGVVSKRVEPTDENLEKFYDLMFKTSDRKGFAMRDKKFMFDYWHNYVEQGKARLYFAEHDGDLLVGAFVICLGKDTYYKDGGSVPDKSKLYASRYLHWFAATDLKRDGFLTYDFSGFPNPENNPAAVNDGLYVFKTVFSHTIDFNNRAFEYRKKYSKYWPKIELAWLKIYYKLKHEQWF